MIIRQLVERLGIAQAINAAARLMKRHKPYATMELHEHTEIDHANVQSALVKLLENREEPHLTGMKGKRPANPARL